MVRATLRPLGSVPGEARHKIHISIARGNVCLVPHARGNAGGKVVGCVHIHFSACISYCHLAPQNPKQHAKSLLLYLGVTLGIVEKKMELTIVCLGYYSGNMENCKLL